MNKLLYLETDSQNGLVNFADMYEPSPHPLSAQKAAGIKDTLIVQTLLKKQTISSDVIKCAKYAIEFFCLIYHN